MKKLIIIIFFSFLANTGLVAQITMASFDSLLFDGANLNNYNNSTLREECNFKVVKVKGKVWGNILITRIEKACGDEYDTAYSIKYGLLKPGDIVVSEGFLRTEEFSQLEIELSGGKNIWLGPTTEFKVGRDYCMGNGTAELLSGTVHIAGGNQGKTYISTPQSMVHITNTEFSVEIQKSDNITTDILRVYEGSVNFGLNMNNKENVKSIEDKSSALQKLLEDYQNGKISIEEFTKKSSELQKDLSDNQPQKTLIVSAGFESKSVGHGNQPTEPIPFDTNENHWWLNF